MNFYLILAVLFIGLASYSSTAAENGGNETSSPSNTNATSTEGSDGAPENGTHTIIPTNATTNATTIVIIPSTTETLPTTTSNSSTNSTSTVATTTVSIASSSTPATSSNDSILPAPKAGRQFHAPSFIGGIVLSVGLMAISYVGFKFYKSRTERNYHTLRESLHM